MSDWSNLFKNYFSSIKSIKKINNYFIINDGENDYLVKVKDTDIIYLYNYFKSINFNYYLPLIDIYEDVYEIYPYYEEIVQDNVLKAKEEIKALAFLHSKTFYEEKINKDYIQEIIEKIKNNNNEIFQYYLNMQDQIDEMEYLLPQYYYLLVNISSIYKLLKKGLFYLDKWFENNSGSIRYSFLILNNNLNNFINGDKKAFLDFKNSKKDFLILDFLDFYKNNFLDVDMNMIYREYNNIFKFNSDDKYLLFSLLCIPSKIVFTKDAYNDCLEINKILNYTYETLQFILKEDEENQKTYEDEFEE